MAANGPEGIGNDEGGVRSPAMFICASAKLWGRGGMLPGAYSCPSSLCFVQVYRWVSASEKYPTHTQPLTFITVQELTAHVREKHPSMLKKFKVSYQRKDYSFSHAVIDADSKRHAVELFQNKVPKDSIDSFYTQRDRRYLLGMTELVREKQPPRQRAGQKR